MRPAESFIWINDLTAIDRSGSFYSVFGTSKRITVSVISRFRSLACAETYRNVLS